MSDARREQPIEDVVRDTVDEKNDPTTRREAVELELEELDRSEEGAEVDVSELAEAPAAGVIDPDLEDPPEPNEPG
jgi:hypothetical protein